jgi:hypothetical protein
MEFTSNNKQFLPAHPLGKTDENKWEAKALTVFDLRGESGGTEKFDS